MKQVFSLIFHFVFSTLSACANNWTASMNLEIDFASNFFEVADVCQRGIKEKRNVHVKK